MRASPFLAALPGDHNLVSGNQVAIGFGSNFRRLDLLASLKRRMTW